MSVSYKPDTRASIAIKLKNRMNINVTSYPEAEGSKTKHKDNNWFTTLTVTIKRENNQKWNRSWKIPFSLNATHYNKENLLEVFLTAWRLTMHNIWKFLVRAHNNMLRPNVTIPDNLEKQLTHTASWNSGKFRQTTGVNRLHFWDCRCTSSPVHLKYITILSSQSTHYASLLYPSAFKCT